MGNAQEAGNSAHFVEVSISTTAGFYPAEGFERVPSNLQLDEELKKAQQHLKIKNTSGWVASVITASGKQVVDANKSYSESALSGRVEIDWGPSEGGGG
jgi:hypothetical protein